MNTLKEVIKELKKIDKKASKYIKNNFDDHTFLYRKKALGPLDFFYWKEHPFFNWRKLNNELKKVKSINESAETALNYMKEDLTFGKGTIFYRSLPKKVKTKKFQLGDAVVLTNALYNKDMIGAIGYIVNPILSKEPNRYIPEGVRYLVIVPEFHGLFWTIEEYLELHNEFKKVKSINECTASAFCSTPKKIETKDVIKKLKELSLMNQIVVADYAIKIFQKNDTDIKKSCSREEALKSCTNAMQKHARLMNHPMTPGEKEKLKAVTAFYTKMSIKLSIRSGVPKQSIIERINQLETR